MEFPCGKPLFRGQNVGCECEKKRSFSVHLVPKSGKPAVHDLLRSSSDPQRAPPKFLPGQVHQILHTQPAQHLTITRAYDPIRQPQPGSHLNSTPRHSPAHSFTDDRTRRLFPESPCPAHPPSLPPNYAPTPPLFIAARARL